MNQRQFKEFNLTHHMDIINLHGKYVGARGYYGHKINLYTVYRFFVEVWYDNFENEITKVQVADKLIVEKLYGDRVNISSLVK